MGMCRHFKSILKLTYKVLAVVTGENFFFVVTFCSLADFYQHFRGPAVSILKCR
jgi:hypothetical protein